VIRRPGQEWELPIAVRLVAVLAVGSLVVAASAGGLALGVSKLGGAAHTARLPPIVLSPLATRSYIYDSTGGQMAVLYADEDREEVPLSSVPKLLQRSVIGIEDRAFYHHAGINARSIFRAVFSNIEAGDIEQGGSTITQQLVKNSLLGTEQTIQRKIKEAALALRLEKQMSKKEILERYLNTVYLGHGAYGVQAGAETYFNEPVDRIGWPEAALLTSLIRNPVGYDPVSYPTLSRRRRALVAHELRSQHIIGAAEERAINAAPLPTQTFRTAQARSAAQLAGSSYFSETVKQELLDLPELGATPQQRYDAVFKGGLRVTTTFDPRAQLLAEKAVAELPDTKGRFAAALASVDPSNGAVRAVVGGTNFATQKFNYATQGWRQPGSSFKFFTLMAAFQYAGAVPRDTISGASPCRFPDPGSPKGVYQAKGGGKVASIDSQTLSSSNCGFLRLAMYTGLDKVAALANAMGITTLVPKVDAEGHPVLDAAGNPVIEEGPVPSNILSMPIGSKEVHPLNMAAAYATAANDGVYNPPYYIEKVTDSKGKVLYRHQPQPLRVVSVQTARLVTQVLAHNAEAGTAKAAGLDHQPSAAKTGTTQENADVWLVGYTPRLSTAVWIGSPEGRTRVVLKGVTQFGAKYPSKIWHDFMESYHDGLPVVDFAEPAPTRRGKSLKYSNKLDRGTVRRRTTTTTAPAAPVTPPAPPVTPAGG
jgi:penicillin-binding protein 1A